MREKTLYMCNCGCKSRVFRDEHGVLMFEQLGMNGPEAITEMVHEVFVNGKYSLKIKGAEIVEMELSKDRKEQDTP